MQLKQKLKLKGVHCYVQAQQNTVNFVIRDRQKKPITRKSYYWDFGYHGNIDFLSMNEMEFAPDRLKQTAGT